MKHGKKILAGVLVCALAFAFCACGNEPAPADGEELVMATNAAFPPYEYYEGEDVVGIDAEIAGAIAEKLGMTLRIEDMEFNAIVSAVQSGKADIGVAGITVTPDRAESVNFTGSYATGIQVVIVPEDSDLVVDDLFALKADGSKWTVGVQEGTTGDIYCTGDLEEPVDENDNPLDPTGVVERYNKGADAVQALLTGKIDCVVIDNEPAKAFVEANEGLKILDTEYIEEDYAICYAKDNEELGEKIDAALQELKDDGTVQSIIDKYITAE